MKVAALVAMRRSRLRAGVVCLILGLGSCGRGAIAEAKASAPLSNVAGDPHASSEFTALEGLVAEIQQGVLEGWVNVRSATEWGARLLTSVDTESVRPEEVGFSRRLDLGPRMSGRIGFSVLEGGVRAAEFVLKVQPGPELLELCPVDNVQVTLVFYSDDKGLVSISSNVLREMEISRETRERAIEKRGLPLGAAWFSGRELSWWAPLDLLVEPEAQTGKWVFSKSIGDKQERSVEPLYGDNIGILLGDLEALSE